MSLYNKYRPQTFDDVVAHGVVVTAVTDQLRNMRFSQSYIMAGQRGTGKTTTAKLMAKAITCQSPINGEACNECLSCKSAIKGSHPDINEIDGASNNGVDNIRDIIGELQYPPIQAKYKIYIIDEVHMLSVAAFNALLKTIEEPPSHVVFILATTELHKVPATIRSRCQIFTFGQIESNLIAERLKYVAKRESINLLDDASQLIAENSEGSMRDALSILEQLSHNDDITGKIVLESLGLIDDSLTMALIDSLIDKNIKESIEIYNGVLKGGKTASQLIESVIKHLSSMIMRGESISKHSSILKSLLNFRREVSKERNLALLFNLFIVDYCTSKEQRAAEGLTEGELSSIYERLDKIESFLKKAISGKISSRSENAGHHKTKIEQTSESLEDTSKVEEATEESLKEKIVSEVSKPLSEDQEKRSTNPKIESILNKLKKLDQVSGFDLTKMAAAKQEQSLRTENSNGTNGL